VTSDNLRLEASLTPDPYGLQLLGAADPQLAWGSDRLAAGQRVMVSNQILGAVHVELSTSELSTQLQISLLQGFVAAILVSIFAGAAVFLMSRSLTSPIATLVTQTRSIAAGDLTRPIEVQGGSFEITELVNTIEDMRQNLHASYTQLEQRVAERTEELKVARDEAVAAQQVATENSRLKSEFLSTMSHELRTPLNAIEGFTSIMLSGMGIELSPRAEDMVKRVSSNSKRLLHLINDFLDLSRIESGRLELVNEPVSLNKLTVKWERQVGVLAEEKGLDFKIQIDPDLPPLILSDEDALSKIAINLLSNAFKFTHQGTVSLDLCRSDGSWIIEVTDTGIGIPPHARDYIFVEFRQVDGSSKRLYGGTGLGLSLVQKLSRTMGGNVSVQSEVGVGSTFTVTLPLAVPEEQEQGVNL
jgi:signal transduction histidine kinase